MLAARCLRLARCSARAHFRDRPEIAATIPPVTLIAPGDHAGEGGVAKTAPWPRSRGRRFPVVAGGALRREDSEIVKRDHQTIAGILSRCGFTDGSWAARMVWNFRADG